ncbi:hypothetical protein C8J57DRAFT_1506105 [Mycena rebaudengoi]|nr:hypothetical protein C8J57DRAFT_1506105 [Mycena rebaudengoi]
MSDSTTAPSVWHNGTFLCLPPWFPDDPSSTRAAATKVYLVTGRAVPQARRGVYDSWNSASAIVSGVSGAAAPGYSGWAAAVAVWQAGCAQGDHPHGVDPRHVRLSDAATSPLLRAERAGGRARRQHTTVMRGIADARDLSPPPSPSEIEAAAAPHTPVRKKAPCTRLDPTPSPSEIEAAAVPHTPARKKVPRTRLDPTPSSSVISSLAPSTPSAPAIPPLSAPTTPAKPSSSRCRGKYTPSQLPTPAAAEVLDWGRVHETPGLRYYGIRWGGVGVVLGSPKDADELFTTRQAQGDNPRMLTTGSFVDATTFAEGFPFGGPPGEEAQRLRWIEENLADLRPKIEAERERRAQLMEQQQVIAHLQAELDGEEYEGSSSFESLFEEEIDKELMGYGGDSTDDIASEIEACKDDPKKWRNELRASGGGWYRKQDELAHLRGLSSMAKGATNGTGRKRSHKNRSAKPGKDSWVHGTKLSLFEGYKETWEAASDSSVAVGNFYTRIMKVFIARYGWNKDYSKAGHDLEEDELPAEKDDNEEAADLIDVDEEVEEHRTYFWALRGKISAWYRYYCKKVLSKQTLEASMDALVASVGGAAIKPRRDRIDHYYSRNYYESRVKPVFTVAWEEAVSKWEEDGDREEEEPCELHIRNMVTSRTLAAEDESFRLRMKAEIEAEYEAAMAVYTAAVGAARVQADQRTAQQFHEVLTTAGATLDPLVELLAERYGMAVTILMAGPIPDKGGNIEVLSAGTTRGTTRKKWHEADSTGFTQVVTSMSRFATLAFSQAECDARALPGTIVAHAPLPTPATGGSLLSGLNLAGVRLSGGGGGAVGVDGDVGGGDELEEGATAEKEMAGGSGRKKGGRKGKENGKKGVKGAAGRRKRSEKAKEAAKKTAATRPAPRPAHRTAESDGAGRPPNSTQAATPPPPSTEPPAIPPPPPGSPPREETPLPPPPLQWEKVSQGCWTEELKRLWPVWEREGAAWGSEWEDCCRMYVHFEDSSGFPYERLRLPKGPRAGTGVDAWINMGRKTFPHARAPCAEYRAIFWKWWRGMQPEERRTTEGEMTRGGGIDWGCLRDFSGKNGLLQVMMAVCWWGDIAHRRGTPEDVEDWKMAMEDVHWALESMVKEGRLSKKRAAERGVMDKDTPPAKTARLIA